jgi:membrane-associated protease RseP (regulator of RpoE activity)
MAGCALPIAAREAAMVRALLLLAASTVPIVTYAADADVVAPPCVHPAAIEPPAPGARGGDRIVFTRDTKPLTGMTTLHEIYGLDAYYPAQNWNLSDGVFVAPHLTEKQIAQLRCDSVVERIVLAPRTPESMVEERPRPLVRLGITFAYDPIGQPIKIGVVVTRVDSGSVAERTGLLPGDRIVKFDEHDIVHGADLLNIMASKRPGDTVGMAVIRNGVETPLVAQF